jgi:hypothetical protein
MGAIVQPKLKPGAPTARPVLTVIEVRRRKAKLHLLTYTVGSALFWVLWAAISVIADSWYWWAVVPVAGWTLALALHLWHAYRPS